MAEYRSRRLRSLSVGDVVTVGEIALAVECAGFRRVRSDTFNEVQEPPMTAETLPALSEIRHDILNVVTGGNLRSATDQHKRIARTLTNQLIDYADRYHRWYGEITASLRGERDAWKGFTNDLIEHHVDGDAAKVKLWERYEDIADTDWQRDTGKDGDLSISTYRFRPGRWRAVVRVPGRQKSKTFRTEEAADAWIDQMILAMRRAKT